MKKFISAFLVLISLSSYTELSPDYRMSPTGDGQDLDETVTLTNTKNGTSRTAVLCPGTGYRCTIQYTDSDGDIITYSSRKGQFEPEIQL